MPNNKTLITSEQEDSVGTPVIAYTEARNRHSWKLLNDLRGGTQAMRDADTEWLPKETKESEDAYKARISRSILFNAYDEAVKKLAGKPFSRPVGLKEADFADDRLVAIEDDVDRNGVCNLTQFCRQLLDTGVDRGLFHILVEYPDVNAEGVRTLADERARNIRPYFVEIHPDNLIGWEHDPETGELISIRYVIYGVETEPGKKYAQTEAKWVVEYNTTEIQKYKYNEESKEWTPDGEAKPNTLGRVPLVTGYLEKDAPMVGLPPLLNLAWLNLAHWQSLSDHRNILRFTRFGLLFGKGFLDEEINNIAIGPTRMISSQNPDADLKYVEHSGRGIAVGEKDLESLENKMAILSMQPLTSRPGSQTATEKSIDEAKSQTTIQAWIRSLETSIEQAYELAALWISADISEDFSVDIFNEFGLTASSELDLKTLTELRKSRDITQTTFLNEVKRRAVLSEELDVEAEVELTSSERENEMQSLNALMQEDEGKGEEEEEEDEEEVDTEEEEDES